MEILSQENGVDFLHKAHAYCKRASVSNRDLKTKWQLLLLLCNMPRHPHKQSTNQTTFHLEFFLDDIIGAPHSKLIGVCLKKSDSGDVISDHLHHFKIMIFGLDHI